MGASLARCGLAAAAAAAAAAAQDASPKRRSVAEVMQWALDVLTPINGGTVYQERSEPMLAQVEAQLEEIAPRLPKEAPWPLYLNRLRWDTAVAQRRHKDAVELGKRLLEDPGCLAEASQENEQENCFPSVLQKLMLECYRSNQLATAAAVFSEHASRHPLTSRYPWYKQMPGGFFIPRSRPSKPFWDADEVPVAGILEQHASAIRAELAGVFEDDDFRKVQVSAFQEERDLKGFRRNTLELCSPRLRSDSPACWQEYNVYNAKGNTGAWSDERCALTPTLCRILQVPEVVGSLNPGEKVKAGYHRGVPGKVGFLRLRPNSRILAHTGPHNGRLTVHLGLKIPEDTYIEVDKEQRRWEEGKALVLDDSFMHEVVNNSPTEDRFILLVHVWHPEMVEELGYESYDAARWQAPGVRDAAEL